MKSISVRATVLVLVSAATAFNAQAASSQKLLTQQQLKALGFHNQTEAELNMNITSVSLDDVTDVSGNLNMDVLWPPTQTASPLPAATPVPGATGQPTGTVNPNPPPASTGAGGVWPPPGGTTAPPTTGPVTVPPATSGTTATSWNGVLAAITGLDVNGWIAIGTTVCRLVTANQPVVNVTTPTISILPQAQPNWTQMEGWGAPVVKKYNVTFYNGFKAAVVKIPYEIMWNANGSLNGAGRYIANLHAVVDGLSTSWMYTVDMQTETHDAVNTGSVGNPIPGVSFDVKVKVHTYLKDIQITQSFFITGAGAIQSLN